MIQPFLAPLSPSSCALHARAQLLTLMLATLLLPSIAIAEGAVKKVLMNENQHAASAEWYCKAGFCSGGDGKEYSCGYVLCGGQISECGCTCLSVSNAPYPKGFCGATNPYPSAVSSGDAPRREGAIPFNLY